MRFRIPHEVSKGDAAVVGTSKEDAAVVGTSKGDAAVVGRYSPSFYTLVFSFSWPRGDFHRPSREAPLLSFPSPLSSILSCMMPGTK